MSSLTIDETEDLIITIRLATAFNPLREPNELLRQTLILVAGRIKTVELQRLLIQWIATGKPYDHYRIFVQALASDIATSSSYPTGPRTN